MVFILAELLNLPYYFKYMKFKSKLQRWYLITVIVFIFGVITLSISISMQVENLFSDYKTSVDTNGFEKAEETFNLLDSTAQDILLKIHSNPSTTLLALAPSIDTVSPVFIRSFQRMQDMVLPFIHSINIVHVETGAIITTDQGWSQVSGDLIYELETNYPKLPHLTPLPLEAEVSRDKTKELVFAYILRDALFKDEGLKHGVILLADVDWFVNGISQADDKNTGTSFYLYHQKYGIIDKEDVSPQISLFSDVLLKNIVDNVENGYINPAIELKPYVIDYQGLGDSDLFLIRVRDETILNDELLFIRIKTAGIFMVFLIVIVVGSIFVNRKIYNPFNSVVSEIRTSIGERLSLPESDLELLNSLYTTLRDEFSEVGEDRVINSCLRSLTQEELKRPEETIEILEKRGIRLSDNYPGCLCLLSIDTADDEFNVKNSIEFSSYMALKYQLKNGADRFVSELELNSASFFLRKGTMMILLYSEKEDIMPDEQNILKLHNFLGSLMNNVVSTAFSPLLNNLQDLGTASRKLSTLLSYRYIYGQGSFISEESRKNAPEDDEMKIVGDMRIEIIKQLSNYKFQSEDFMRYSNLLKKWSVENVQDELNEFALDLTKALSGVESGFQSQEFFRDMINQPTLDDFCILITSFAEEHKGSVQQTDSRHSALIVKAREIIEKNYSDPALSINMVADTLKMSPPYFGMIFKKAVGTPFADYLTMVRIQESAHLLKSTRNSVQEIMLLVGIPSESTFYRRFREIFNLTPQLYRKQSVLSETV